MCSSMGHVMTMGGCPVHWTSKVQTKTALSTTEAEHIALCHSFRECIPMRRFFNDMLKNFGLEELCPVAVKSQIFEDNNGVISTATTPKMTTRMKHIDVA